MAQGLREQLIGAWKLVSYEERPVDGSPSFYPMSEQPMGIIMYTPDGYMSAQLSSCFGIRVLAIRYGWQLPIAKAPD
jgi:Lipocalin-like domain